MGAKYGGSDYLIINVQVAEGLAPRLRGRRVRVGMWLRLGGGTVVPGFTLRMFGMQDGEHGYLGGISHQGGIEDAAVWNRFEVEGVILPATDSIDIHISAVIPTDPKLRDEAVFYMDDVSVRPLTPVPVKIESPLDELYVGEPARWQVSTFEPAQRLTVSLLQGAVVVQETVIQDAGTQREGVFPTQELAPGMYRLRAVAVAADGAEQTAWRDIVLAPDPFAW